MRHKQVTITGLEVKYDKRKACKLEECGFIDCDLIIYIKIGSQDFKYWYQAIVSMQDTDWPTQDIIEQENKQLMDGIELYIDYLAKNNGATFIGDACKAIEDALPDVTQAMRRKEPYNKKI